MTQWANCSLTPKHALQLAYGCPPAFRANDVCIRDLCERNFLHFRICQKPRGRGVFTLEVVEPLDPSRHDQVELHGSPDGNGAATPAVLPVAGRIEALPQVEGLSNSG